MKRAIRTTILLLCIVGSADKYSIQCSKAVESLSSILSCHQVCSCHVEPGVGKMLDCERRSIDSFHSIAAENLAEANLSSNNLRWLNEDAFQTNTNLQTIDLFDNLLINLTQRVFRNLRNLTYINLAQNRLTYSSLPLLLFNDQRESLQSLYLKNQGSYQDSPPSGFYNSLQSLEEISMTGHSTIDESFSLMGNLKVISFGGRWCRMVDIDMEHWPIDPYSFNNVEQLYLSNCTTTFLDLTFLHNFPNLRVLDLSLNNIGDVLMKDNNGVFFSRSAYLQELDLSKAGIKKAPPRNMFRGLTNLTTLVLKSNELQELDFLEGCYRFNTLRVLDLQNNSIACIDHSHQWHLDRMAEVADKHEPSATSFLLLLQGNPFVCMCPDVPIITAYHKWLTTRSYIKNANSYICERGDTAKGIRVKEWVNRRAPCSSPNTSVLIVVSIISVALLSALTIVAYLNYSKAIIQNRTPNSIPNQTPTPIPSRTQNSIKNAIRNPSPNAMSTYGSTESPMISSAQDSSTAHQSDGPPSDRQPQKPLVPSNTSSSLLERSPSDRLTTERSLHERSSPESPPQHSRPRRTPSSHTLPKWSLSSKPDDTDKVGRAIPIPQTPLNRTKEDSTCCASTSRYLPHIPSHVRINPSNPIMSKSLPATFGSTILVQPAKPAIVHAPTYSRSTKQASGNANDLSESNGIRADLRQSNTLAYFNTRHSNEIQSNIVPSQSSNSISDELLSGRHPISETHSQTGTNMPEVDNSQDKACIAQHSTEHVHPNQAVTDSTYAPAAELHQHQGEIGYTSENVYMQTEQLHSHQNHLSDYGGSSGISVLSGSHGQSHTGSSNSG